MRARLAASSASATLAASSNSALSALIAATALSASALCFCAVPWAEAASSAAEASFARASLSA